MSLKPYHSYLAPLVLGVWPLAGCFYNPTGSATGSTTIEELTPQERGCIECPDTAQLCFCLDPEADTEDDPWGPPDFACTPESVAKQRHVCAEIWEVDVEDLEPDQFFCAALLCGEDTEVEPTTGEPPACASWSPASMITTSAGTRFLDDAVVVDLLADPSPLLLCDDVTLTELVTGGGFEVDQAGAGELLYELGLRDGDIPLTLNGFSLATVAEAMAAVHELWFVEGETDFDLAVQRPVGVVTLFYSVY